MASSAASEDQYGEKGLRPIWGGTVYSDGDSMSSRDSDSDYWDSSDCADEHTYESLDLPLYNKIRNFRRFGRKLGSDQDFIFGCISRTRYASDNFEMSVERGDRRQSSCKKKLGNYVLYYTK